MRVVAAIDVSAPAELVWEQVTTPGRYLHFLAGVTRWESEDDTEDASTRAELGSRYRMLMRVGSAEVGGLVEIVEHAECRDLAWTSLTGIDQRGRWRLRELEDGTTRVELRLAYGVAGSGIWGQLAERLAARTVRANLRRSLQQLKRQVEHEQTRAAARARREARAS